MGLYIEDGMSRDEKLDLVLEDFIDMVGNPKANKYRNLFIIDDYKRVNSRTRVYMYFPRTGMIQDETQFFTESMMRSFELVGFKNYSYRDISILLKRWKQTLPRLNMDFKDSSIRCNVTVHYY